MNGGQTISNSCRQTKVESQMLSDVLQFFIGFSQPLPEFQQPLQISLTATGEQGRADDLLLLCWGVWQCLRMKL